MKKLLALLPAATFALTGCLSSSDNSATAPATDTLPTDYIVLEMGEFVYEDGNFAVTRGSCTAYANDYQWKKEQGPGFLRAIDDHTAGIDLTASGNKGSYEYKALAGEPFPNGSFYKSSSLKNSLIEGIILEDPYYSDVAFINTECLFQNFGEMQQTMALIAKVPQNTVTMECNKISIQGHSMEYMSHEKDAIKYKLSFAGKTCTMDHRFLYAYSKDDCAKAFANYQQEYENGETDDFFDFELYDQDLHASAECSDVLSDFHNATGLAKSGETSTISEKQVKDILRAVGARLRGRK